MKIRNVSSVLMPFVESVCRRDGIQISEKYWDEDSDVWQVAIPVSSRRFAEIVVDAKCERQRSQSDGLPVLSYRTIMNPTKRRRLLQKSGVNGFHVLYEDEGKMSALDSW